MKKLKFHFEAIIGDRYESTDSLSKNEIHDWLLNIQKQDILKAETENEYWEDIPEELFELFKTNIKAKNYEYTMAKGHLWLEMEISIEPEPEEGS
jgi:hypothetical protein|tara:strand:+ start:460 stop:744 length:285 start_codon:yes stop_codon:yes gene_type:complete